MAIIRKGDAYALPVIILADGTPITDADVAGVRIGLGTITAIWPDGQLRYDSGVWLLPITQAQSYTLPQGDVYYQVQVQMSSGETLSSPHTKIHIDSSIFRQPWGKRELDTGGSVEASAVTAAVSLHPESIASEIQNPGVVYGRDAVKYTPQTLTDEQKRQARENIGASDPYVLPQATADALGGVKADAKTDADVLPVHIDTDGNLWTNIDPVDATEDFKASGAASDIDNFDVPEVLKWAMMAKAGDASSYRVNAGKYFIVDGTYRRYYVEVNDDIPDIRYVTAAYHSDDGFVGLYIKQVLSPGVEGVRSWAFDPDDGIWRFDRQITLPSYDSFNGLDDGKVLKINGSTPEWMDFAPTDATADFVASGVDIFEWPFLAHENNWNHTKYYGVKAGAYKVVNGAIAYYVFIKDGTIDSDKARGALFCGFENAGYVHVKACMAQAPGEQYSEELWFSGEERIFEIWGQSVILPQYSRSGSDAGKVLVINGNSPDWEELPTIPTATATDSGKFLTVDASGNYVLAELPKYDGGVS